MKRFYSLFALPLISAATLANEPLPDRQTELPAVKKRITVNICSLAI